MTDELGDLEIDVPEPSFRVETVSETEKSKRRKFDDARRRAKRRGTWLVGAWSAMLATIAAAWWRQVPSCEGITILILGGAIFTGLYGVYYACQVGFVRALLGKSGIGEMPWSSVLWVTLWSTLVGGVSGLFLSFYVLRGNHFFVIFLVAIGASAVGAALGNQLVERKYARMKTW